MSVLIVFLYALVVVVSLLLIGLILIQPSKSGGMGAAFGGIGESMFGGKAGSHLTKATVVMTVIFFVLALALAAMIGHNRSRSKVADYAKANNHVQQNQVPAMNDPQGVTAVDAAASDTAAKAESAKAAPAAEKKAEPAKGK